DESLQIIKGMFEQEKMTLHGRHYNVTDAVCSPKPLQKPHPPIMIGGQGQRVLLKIVAKHADMWNVPGASAERYADLLKVIEASRRYRRPRHRSDREDDHDGPVLPGAGGARKGRARARRCDVGSFSGASPSADNDRL